MATLIQDDKGNNSSTRVLLFLLFSFVIWMYVDWRWAMRIEMLHEKPNYEGITQLFNAMLVGFGALVLGMIIKLIQKKIEK